jgi:hypothetical protein
VHSLIAYRLQFSLEFGLVFDLVLEKDFRFFFESDFRKFFIPYKQQPEAGAAKVRKAF